MTQRIARIIDRARTLEERMPAADESQANAAHAELRALSHRLRLVNRAVSLCVIAALLICGVIGGLFITAYYAWSPDLTRVVALVFAAALLSLIIGLLCFLREVHIATATLRFGVR
jgi:phage shock protein PspC (stress-responsive transcriptional regulator)